VIRLSAAKIERPVERSGEPIIRHPHPLATSISGICNVIFIFLS
jgi:hypothetical protein